MALEEIAVRSRTTKGSGPAGRMRREGRVPAVIYGHGKEAESLSVERRIIERLINQHHRVVGLKHEESGESRRALIKDVQYNPINDQVIHVDFVEVSEHEKVDVTVPLVFRGEAAGVKDGGVLQIHLHELEIECPADEVLEELRVEVSHVEVGQIMHVNELTVPEGVTVVTDAGTAVVGCRMPKGSSEDEAEPTEAVEGEAAPAQPEVISETKREERTKDKDDA